MTDILVLNAGSSSVKYRLLSWPSGDCRLSGQVDGIGSRDGRHQWRLEDEAAQTEAMPKVDHAGALAVVFRHWRDNALPRPCLIGHRVVHGGERFTEATVIDVGNLAELAALDSLAPLHNPVNRLGIETAMRYFPGAIQVAVFDTAFHARLPERAYRYAVPEDWYRRFGIRRYGFHGLAHASALVQAASYLDRPASALNLITLHLGNGASACAIDNGVSVDTSMGFTPLAGLVMGTRSGDIDPALPGYLADRTGWSAAEIDERLNHESGLLGLCGASDMREIVRRASGHDPDAERALAVFVYRVQKYIGAYWAILGRVDALVFTGGIGEHSAEIRERVCAPLAPLGLRLDQARNQRISDRVTEIGADRGAIKILVIEVDEAWQIALESARAGYSRAIQIDSSRN